MFADDWGWHYPLELVKRAHAIWKRSGVMPTPEQVAAMPEDWEVDLIQFDNLWEFYDHEDERKDPGEGAKKWGGTD